MIHDMLMGEVGGMTFEVNGQEYNRYYLMTNGIYPPWSCFVQSIHQHGDVKGKHFAFRQEACRKEVMLRGVSSPLCNRPQSVQAMEYHY